LSILDWGLPIDRRLRIQIRNPKSTMDKPQSTIRNRQSAIGHPQCCQPSA
jgi:hypothetical protein